MSLINKHLVSFAAIVLMMNWSGDTWNSQLFNLEIFDITHRKKSIVFQPPNPDFQWYWTLDGPHHGDSGSDMVVDRHGNMFVSGHHGGIDLDRDGILDLEADVIDPIFFKVVWNDDDEWRHRVPWFKTAKSPGYNMQTLIAADQSGGAYITGRFRDEIEFENGIVLKGCGKNDSYLTRIDEDGNALWGITFGGDGDDAILDITSDQQGNVFFIGTTQGKFSIDGKSEEIPGSSEKQFVIVSLDPEGGLRWIHNLGTSMLYGFMECTPNGRIYIAVDYQGAVDLNADGIMDFGSDDGRDGFVARFNTDGVLEENWKVGAGPGKLSIAPDETVYLLGASGEDITEMYGMTDFDDDGKDDLSIKNDEGVNTWIAAYTPNGSLEWVRSYNLDRPSNIASNGEWIALTGSYTGVRDLDEDGANEPSDATVDVSKEYELATILVNPKDGIPYRVWVAPGPGNDHIEAVRFYPGTDLVRVTGYIQLTADFSGDDKLDEGMAQCESLGDLFYAEYRVNHR